MKTRTAPWDYNRPTGIAPYNATCPICKHPCYSSAIPNGMLYTCPKCGTMTLTNPITIKDLDEKLSLLHADIVARTGAVL